MGKLIVHVGGPATFTVAKAKSKADARLIAAAPDLLTELKAVQQQCLFGDEGGIGVSEDMTIPGDMFDRICATINKAEGRS